MNDRDGEDLTQEEHVQLATEMHERWQNGEPKSRLEIEYWDNATSHGKAFTAYVKRWLGVETERQSSQSTRIQGVVRSCWLRGRGLRGSSSQVVRQVH